MSISDINKNYILNDGKIIRIEFSFESKEMNIELQVRKSISINKYKECKIRLMLIGVTEFEIFEDFPTNGEYSDLTFTEISYDEIYLSFDPYGNSGQPNEKDNWVIKAKIIKLTEIQTE